MYLERGYSNLGVINMNKYDFLIVGSGLFGAIFAFLAREKGYRCLVIEKRDHIAGNIYTEQIEGIEVHRYGAHIFHTQDREVWNFMLKFVEFNHFINSPIAYYRGKLYNLPFNMNTFYQMWGVKSPKEARDKIFEQRRKAGISSPKNLEEQAISLVGEDIYEALIKGYTEKQWGRPCSELPTSIIKRLPVRFRFDNNYFNDPYQGIPIGGYTKIVEKLLFGTEVKLNTDFVKNQPILTEIAKKIIYTGPIDEYFNFCYGPLEYRSIKFETQVLNIPNYQGVAVVNYTESSVPYTRVIEHKHFEFGTQPKTVISREFSKEWDKGDEPYYPINDEKNIKLYENYMRLASNQNKTIFCGRLGGYKYYNMDQVVRQSMDLASQIL